MKFRHMLLAAPLALTISGAALAQPAGHDHAAAALPAAAAEALSEAEIRRIDLEKGTLLLKHGEIRNLGMSPMTMGFKLREPKLAQGLKVGDKIRFAAVLEGETLVVTKIVKP